MKKHIQPFIILKDDSTGFVFIQQTSGLLISCKVWEFKRQEDFDKYAPKLSNNGLQIGDYRIVITFWGSLSKSVDPDKCSSIQQVLQDMAQFFYDERIAKSPEYYDKYRKERV